MDFDDKGQDIHEGPSSVALESEPEDIGNRIGKKDLDDEVQSSHVYYP